MPIAVTSERGYIGGRRWNRTDPGRVVGQLLTLSGWPNHNLSFFGINFATHGMPRRSKLKMTVVNPLQPKLSGMRLRGRNLQCAGVSIVLLVIVFCGLVRRARAQEVAELPMAPRPQASATASAP